MPFLTALKKQCDLYKVMERDMLKDGPSLPSIGMLYGMRGSKGLFHMFGANQADLAELMNTAIMGGPSTQRLASLLCGQLSMLPRRSPVAPWLVLVLINFTPGPWHRKWPSGPARSKASQTMAWMPRACPTDIGHAIAGPPSNGWPTRRKPTSWRACCMPPTGLRCDWACGTCPWVAIIRTQPQCSSSMAACFTVKTVASSRMSGSALLPRRGGSTPKGMKTTWGPLVVTRSQPSGSVSRRPSSVLSPAEPGQPWSESAQMSPSCQQPAPICQPLGPICRHFCRPYMRTVSSASPRWILIHPRGWWTSSGTYWPSSSLSQCQKRMLDCIWPSSARTLV